MVTTCIPTSAMVLISLFRPPLALEAVQVNFVSAHGGLCVFVAMVPSNRHIGDISVGARQAASPQATARPPPWAICIYGSQSDPPAAAQPSPWELRLGAIEPRSWRLP